MYKNQLQELAQRSCFNLPSYSCLREGPDHAPRFKASVNFNGETFDSPHFCTTLRQAEHSAAEVALHSLSSRAPSHSLAAKILDETGVYKNLLQEISQRVGARLPSYTTYRSGLGHLPVFTCTVELAGITFTGEPAKNKKQAEKNAAMAAWSALKKLAKQESSSSSSLSSSSDALESNEELEQITIARALLRYQLKEKIAMANNPDAAPFPKRFPVQPDKRPSAVHSSAITGSKILPLIRPMSAPKARPPPAHLNDMSPQCPENHTGLPVPRKFPAAGAIPYVPLGQYSARIRSPYHDVAPPVSMRTAVPVFSAPPRRQFQPVPSTPVRIAQPVQIRQAVPVCAAAPRPATSTTTPIQASVTKEEHKKQTMTVSPPHLRPTISEAPAESSAEKTPEQLAPPAAVTVSEPSSVNDAPLLAVSGEQKLQDGLEGNLKQQLNIV